MYGAIPVRRSLSTGGNRRRPAGLAGQSAAQLSGESAAVATRHTPLIDSYPKGKGKGKVKVRAVRFVALLKLDR